MDSLPPCSQSIEEWGKSYGHKDLLTQILVYGQPTSKVDIGVVFKSNAQSPTKA